MRCPYCKSDNDRVIDSRASADGFAIRRRRVCLECGRRYTTYERVEHAPLRVVKKSGERVEFARGAVRSGLTKACEKRPVSVEQIDGIVDRIERQCLEAFDKEVPSKVIGKLVMDELRQLDQVAYVRFASVYREFKDVEQFLEELKPMLGQRGDSEESMVSTTSGGKSRGVAGGRARPTDRTAAGGRSNVSGAAGDAAEVEHEGSSGVASRET